MTEEKPLDRGEPEAEEKPEKDPETEAQKDATEERVLEEEQSGGALPSNHSDED